MAKGVKGSTPPKEEQRARTSFNILPSDIKQVKVLAAENGTTMQNLIDEGIAHVIKKYSKDK